jgi:DNA repair protein RadC
MVKGHTVLDMPMNERPRERLARLGATSVSAQELLAVVLGRGTAGRSVMIIAQDLLVNFKSLEGVVNAPVEALQNVKGLGLAKALQLKACLEIARRVVRDEAVAEEGRNKTQAVADPADIAGLVRPLVRDWKKEHFFVASFDNRNRVLGVDLIGIGTLNANLVHPRETFGTAIGHSASHIAIAHNHPSGDPTPSEADVTVTKRLKEAGELMGIHLLDHVVISKSVYFSFRENGLV